jgi:NTE family protein
MVSRKLGLVLGSGGARGWAHIGVLRVLEEAGIAPDIICGTSVGAVVGALHIGGHLPGFADWLLRLNRIRFSRFFDFRLGTGGFIAGKRVLEMLEERFGAIAIEAMPTAFACVATELNSGDEIWLRQGKLLDALRASYAIPGILPPVQISGSWLIDGALVNPVPVSLARALGADLIVAVDVNAGRLHSALTEEAKVELTGRARLDLRRYFSRDAGGHSPFGVLSRTLQIVQTRITRMRLAQDPPDVSVIPNVGHIGQMEYLRAAECIAAGEVAARAVLADIRAGMGEEDKPARRAHTRGSGHGKPSATAP